MTWWHKLRIKFSTSHIKSAATPIKPSKCDNIRFPSNKQDTLQILRGGNALSIVNGDVMTAFSCLYLNVWRWN